jgi:hypothetical protein
MKALRVKVKNFVRELEISRTWSGHRLESLDQFERSFNVVEITEFFVVRNVTILTGFEELQGTQNREDKNQLKRKKDEETGFGVLVKE